MKKLVIATFVLFILSSVSVLAQLPSCADDPEAKCCKSEGKVLCENEEVERDDFDGDNQVTTSDLTELAKHVIKKRSYQARLDLDDNGRIDILDLVRFIKNDQQRAQQPPQPDPEPTGPQAILLVDFGTTKETSSYGIPEWTEPVHDVYVHFFDLGPGGTATDRGTNGVFNYQGVQGTSYEFEEGDVILVHWYNVAPDALTFSPKISFTDNNRILSREEGDVWYDFEEISIPSDSAGTSMHNFTQETAGSYAVVNVNSNHNSDRLLVVDKIVLVERGADIDSEPISLIEDSETAPPPPPPEEDPTPEPEPDPEPTPRPEIPPDPEGFQRHVIMDFEDDVLHDKDWLRTQPDGTVDTVVAPSFAPEYFSLAVGEGRNGGNALKIEVPNADKEYPEYFYIVRYTNRLNNMRDDRAYLLPRDKRANRLSMWVKYSQNPGLEGIGPKPAPAYQNMHIGTYHFDPALLGTRDTKESNNWHFYHQIWARPDKAQGEWVNIILNEFPQHQRSVKGSPPVNPTAHAGNYWELLTRFYFQKLWVSYYKDEIEFPYTIWVDDIEFLYVPEDTHVDMRFIHNEIGEKTDANRSVNNYFPFEIEGLVDVCGTVGMNAPYWMNGAILNFDGSQFERDLCLSAGEIVTGKMQVQPREAMNYGYSVNMGISFVPDEYINPEDPKLNPSQSDGFIEQRSYGFVGSHDANAYRIYLRPVMADPNAG